jgi:hypothetical protein
VAESEEEEEEDEVKGCFKHGSELDGSSRQQ